MTFKDWSKYSAIILGTGPSLDYQKDDIVRLRAENKVRIFGVNMTWKDFQVDALICCDPKFHEHYGKIEGDFIHYHWDKDICEKYGYEYIEGRWGDGLSTDRNYIHYGHSSGYQAIGLAAHSGCDTIYLCGYDMRYSGPRHYFAGLSKENGEYPEVLRKYSTFDGLIKCYQTIADQKDCPKIYNCTMDSAMECFEKVDIKWL